MSRESANSHHHQLGFLIWPSSVLDATSHKLHRIEVSSTVTMMMPAWLLLVVLLLLPTFLHAEDVQCDACLFDGGDSDGCIVYGSIDGELATWSLGSEDCLAVYKITIATPDPSVICASVNSFVADVRFGFLASSSARAGLGVAAGGFFDETDSGLVLSDNITINSIDYDCTVSAADCYNAMKDYFATPPGSDEMDDVCTKLVRQVRVDKELEQSTLRIRLCGEYPNLPDVCQLLADQVASAVEEYPDKQCSAFGFGPTPAANQLPDACIGIVLLETDNNSLNETSAAVTRMVPWPMVMAIWVL